MPAGAFALLLLVSQFAQSSTGELRLTVTDAGQLPLAASVELASDVNQVHERFAIDQSGVLVAKRLPFGTYRILVHRDRFAPFVGTVDIRSALPAEYHVTLGLAPLQTEVTVAAADTLLDTRRTTTEQRLGAETIRARTAALPGRALPELVNTQPGWLLEANGILHPRGSEYQTQYVIDGLPLTDNRSPSFAPEIDADDVHAVRILTGGYPAEYGRKLGGIVEVVTGGVEQRGFHGSAVGSIGSFGTRTADASVAQASPRTSIGIAAGAAATDRYLDPPVEDNFTNHGTTSHVAVHVDRDVTDTDRLGVILRYGRSAFLVPNERVQEEVGQRQSRDSREAAAQLSYQHIFSASALADVRAMARDLSAGLSSDRAATPVLAAQDRGIRDLYLKATISLHRGVHEWKAGGDLVAGTVRERFAYLITDPSPFDPATRRAFAFDDRRADREQSLFVQDHVQLGSLTLNAGVRWDHYRLAVDESGVSPRIGVAWSWPGAGLVARASYDRAFQTPAVENLLLASSPAVDALSDSVLQLPIEPSLGNFYEVGVSKAIAARLRIDASAFRRAVTNFADDDVLLNTGISFPIAFSRATISGTEVALALPRWRGVTASASYGYLRGVGALPITGGLLLGSEARRSLTATDEFPITQDQRHTVRARASWQMTPMVWIAIAGAYGSGLPVEFDGDRAQAVAQYGERIVDRVDLDAGRVRPSWSMDASIGVLVAKAAARSVRLQMDVRNLTDRLNVINFAGLFSGTAIAPPRSIAVRVRAEF